MEELEQGFNIKDFVDQSKSHNIENEFEKLADITSDKKIESLLLTDEQFKVYNRYSQVLPYKQNCVKLARDIYGENTYINASYINTNTNDTTKPFIVCQSPLDHTIVDFWRMVIKEGVHTIIMLCKLKTDSKIQSSEYFPSAQNIKFDQFKGVKLIKLRENREMSLIERHFQVQADDGTIREVVHYQWEGWPDYGVPKEDQHPVIFYLLDKIEERRKLGNQPIVVHCSAGIGRSGTFMSIHNISEIIKTYNTIKGTTVEEKARISVFNVVRKLREQRFGMVETLAQYQMLYNITRKILQSCVNFQPLEELAQE